MNFGQLQTYVLDRLDIPAGDTSRLTQVQTALVQSHLRLVNRYRLKVGLTTLNVVAGTATVALPADFVRIQSLWRSGQQLIEVSRSDIAALNSSTAVSTSGPYAYAMEGQATIRLFPTPSTTTSGYLTLDYLQRATVMSANSDTPDSVPLEYHDVIGEMAIEVIAAAEGDALAAQSASARIAEIRADMDRTLINRGGPGQLNPPVAGYAFKRRAR